jgi:hypothetical protein
MEPTFFIWVFHFFFYDSLRVNHMFFGWMSNFAG